MHYEEKRFSGRITYKLAKHGRVQTALHHIDNKETLSGGSFLSSGKQLPPESIILETALGGLRHITEQEPAKLGFGFDLPPSSSQQLMYNGSAT